jgi:hypothetical protein
MATKTFSNLKDALTAMRKDARMRTTRLKNAVRRAARDGARYIVDETVPTAFEELADSVHVEVGGRGTGSASVVVDAPHAAAVENGARPHWPPLDPIIHWVELRGIQGITQTGRLVRSKKKIREEDASVTKHIAKRLRTELGGVSAAASWRARASTGSLARSELGADPAVVAVARAIQVSIAKKGTPPRKYVQRAVYPTVAFLDEAVRRALPDQGESE